MTTTATKSIVHLSTLDKLIKFVNQRPGLDFRNYGEWKAYNQEAREITKDRSDFYELLGYSSRRVDNLEAKITAKLSNNSDRLTMDAEGNLQYCTGQYFPTEYRPAASRLLRGLIWDSLRDEKDAEGQPVYKDGHEIRKAARRNLSRRVCKNYFN